MRAAYGSGLASRASFYLVWLTLVAALALALPVVGVAALVGGVVVLVKTRATA